MTRSPSGDWRAHGIPRANDTSELAVDSMQRPHVVSVSNLDDLIDGLPDSAPDVFWPTASSHRRIHPASAGGGRVAVLLSSPPFYTDEMALYVPDGNGTVREQLLGMRTLTITGCTSLPRLACSEQPATPCTERGDGVAAQTLAATSNGGLWLTYLVRHVDRDMIQSCPRGEWLYPCRTDIRADRSTAEIVLARVPTDGTSVGTGNVRWRAAVALTPLDTLSVVGRGTQLTLVFSSSVIPGRSSIRYLVLETTNL